ncbi:hypothetical protein Tco_0720861 [Tanacetum coccineum]
MASLDHRLNPLFSIKECSSCGALYTADFCCSKGGLEDKILVPKPPQNCTTCGDSVDGLYCRPCAFVRKCLNEGWYTIHDENEILNTFESSNDNTNIVSAPQEPFVFNQDPGVNSSQSPPQINNNCCYECGDSLDDIFCQRCTYTSKEILQAQEDLMEAIQAFLKEYDHIPPNEKCMALLLAEERFLKIKQIIEEKHNQPGVMQELLLKLMDDLQILKRSQQEKKETTAQSFTSYWDFSMIDDEEDRDNFLKDVCTFLRKFSRIPFGVTLKVILLAWESFGKIKDALMDKQYQQEDIQELMSKLQLKAITPDLPIEEPDNSLSIGDEHLDTIPSVKNLIPILSELEGISDNTCDVPVCEDPSNFDALNDHSEILSDSNNDGTSSDDDSYENIKYVEASPLNLEYDSLEEVNDVDQENHLITNIESLKDNPTPDHVFKSSSSFPITDSDSFFEKSNTSFSHLDNSLPEFETLSDHTEETISGSTTTHANNSLHEYDSFLFKIEPDQGGLTSVVIFDNLNDPLLELPEFESFHFDPLFPRPPPEPPDDEISLIIKIDAPVINNFDELNEVECFDPGGDEIDVEDDDSFTFVIQTFLQFLTYPMDSPFLYSFGSEDPIFDPGIST